MENNQTPAKPKMGYFTKKRAEAGLMSKKTLSPNTAPEAEPQDFKEKFTGMFKDLDVGICQYQEKLAKNILNTFQDHMLKVTDDVARLKIDAEKEDTALKTNQKIKSLEAGLEWFKQESLKLTDKNNAQKKEIEKWRGKAEVFEQDIKFLQTMVKSTKKEVKTLRYKLSQCTCKNIKEEIDDPSVFKELSSHSQIRPSLLSPREFKYEDSTMIFDKTQLDKNMNSLNLGSLVLKHDHSNEQLTTLNRHLVSNSSNVDFSTIDAKEFLKQHEYRSNKVILLLKRQIEHLKRKIRDLTQIKVNNVQKESELEKIFLQ